MLMNPSKPLAAVLCAGLLVSACTTTDPYTRESKTSTTVKGAGIGALGGAALGALVGVATGSSPAKAALIGAGVGTLAGAGVGYYMDRQEARLRERLDQTGVGIRRVGDDIQLVMPGDITFATGSSAISPNFAPVLDDVALVLNEFDSTFVEVSGFTDTVGKRSYNQGLSERRANSVARYLAGQGVIGERLLVAGFGETRLAVPTRDGVAEQRNRRVEIRIVPLT